MKFREWSRSVFRPPARFVLRHWLRYDEFVRLRQQVRYLAIGQLLSRAESDERDLALFELSIFSQNGEDGVLHEIFKRIAAEIRFFVEIGSNVNESNCQLLGDVFGWNGVIIEADDREYRALRKKYDALPLVRVVQALVQPTTVENLFRQHRVPSEFDLLSIDVDGNDYWIWKGLKEFHPRVVVIEYNSALPQDENLVQAWDPRSRPNLTEAGGASLAALGRLGLRKGYRLVHAELSGTNAFFVRNDVADDLFIDATEVSLRATNYFLAGIRHERRGEPKRLESPDDAP